MKEVGVGRTEAPGLSLSFQETSIKTFYTDDDGKKQKASDIFFLSA
jgi:hypothetical protein